MGGEVRGGEERQQEAIRRRFHTRVHTTNNTTEHSDGRKEKIKGKGASYTEQSKYLRISSVIALTPTPQYCKRFRKNCHKQQKL